jgi:hypothetical protein
VVVFSVGVHARKVERTTRHNTSTFRAVDGLGPPWHSIPTAARTFLATLEAMMDLVFIIYVVTNILVLCYVHQSRFLESGD